jgi:hypothetical protein
MSSLNVRFGAQSMKPQHFRFASIFAGIEIWGTQFNIDFYTFHLSLNLITEPNIDH